MIRSMILALAAVLAIPALADDPTPLYFQTDTPITNPAPPPTSPVVQLLLAGQGPRPVCTGFYVGSNSVVTAGHCVIDRITSSFVIVANNGLSMKVWLAAFSNPVLTMDDWAIFRIGEPTPGSWDAAKLDCTGKQLPIGTEVRAEGFPEVENSDFRATFGRISGLNSPRPYGTFPVIHAQVAVLPGHSGGPLFRMSDNVVVGITVSAGQLAQNFAPKFNTNSEFTPIAVVCPLLHL